MPTQRLTVCVPGKHTEHVDIKQSSSDKHVSVCVGFSKDPRPILQVLYHTLGRTVYEGRGVYYLVVCL